MRTRVMTAAWACVLMGCAGLASGAGLGAGSGPLSSGFTYQGSLSSGGAVVDATADFEFTLWDAAVGGSQIGVLSSASGVSVAGGLFTVGLDFGVEVFDGGAVWLEASVRSPAGGGGAYTTLGTRQALTAVPYALQTRGLFVRDDLNVGIGTTSPTSPLTVLAVGGGNAVSMEQSDSGNPFATLVTEHHGTGPGVLSFNRGLGRAGDFRTSNADNEMEAVRGLNQGAGPAGVFEINNTGSRADALRATTNGSGNAGLFETTNAISGAAALRASSGGPGPAAVFDGDVQVGSGIRAGNLTVIGTGDAPSISASSGWYAIRGTHDTTTGSFPGVWGDTNSTSSNANGVRGYVNSTSPGGGSAGVRGINNGTNNNGYGVYGSHSGGGYGVTGTSVSGRGVYGTASGTAGTTYGVYGVSSSPTGNGVFGWALDSSGQNYGVHGISNSDAIGSAGVNGYSNDGTGVQGGSVSFRGVYGSSISGNGVYGRSSSSNGVLGWATGASGYGVIGIGGQHALYASGSMAATGAKSFIQPHPEDAGKQIRFVCLEGNESGTYFRGSARLEDGRAYIEVPEAFRLVSEAEGLTVQLTARGPDAGLWIESNDLDRVVVMGSGDVEFDYFVNGVRRGFADVEIEMANRSFVPEVRGLPFGGYMRPEQREILVENGILNADFTPNEQTAKRMGWELREPNEEELTDAGRGAGRLASGG